MRALANLVKTALISLCFPHLPSALLLLPPSLGAPASAPLGLATTPQVSDPHFLLQPLSPHQLSFISLHDLPGAPSSSSRERI